MAELSFKTKGKIINLLQRLEEDYSIKIDLKRISKSRLSEMYMIARAKKDKIISESSFNEYFTNKEYAKNMLIMEVVRLLLREIQPKRMNRKITKTNENNSKVNSKSNKNKIVENQGEVSMSNKNQKSMKIQKLKEAIRQKLEKIKATRSLHNVDFRRLMTENEINEFETSISTLLEAEYEQYEVIAAAKNLSGDLQKMAENLASMSVEDFMPLIDRMKSEFGPEKTETFENNVQESLQSALEQIKKTKEVIDNETLRLEGKYDGDNDMAKFGLDGEKSNDGMDMSGSDENLGGNQQQDDDILANLDVKGNEDGGNTDDLGGFEPASGPEAEPLGRAKKDESYRPKHRKVTESKTTKSRPVRKLPESKKKLIGVNDYPSEIQEALTDFEYYISNRKLKIREARERCIERYRKLSRSLKETHEYCVSEAKFIETLDRYIHSNKARLLKIVRKNSIVMPDVLSEHIEKTGFEKTDFEQELQSWFAFNRDILSESDYSRFINDVAEETERNPAELVKFILSRITERKEQQKIFERQAYKQLMAKILDESREKDISIENIISKLNEKNRSIYYAGNMHDSVMSNGFANWVSMNSGRKILESIKSLSGKTIKLVLEMAAKANEIYYQYKDENGYVNEFGLDLMKQLDEEYKKIAHRFEKELTENYKG